MKSRFRLFVIVLFISGIVVFLLSSDLFSLKNICVSGNKTIQKGDIIDLSGLMYGQNILKMNKNKAIKNILLSPKVKAVRIKRNLPSGVSVDLIEREAIAIVPYLGSYLNIDDEAYIIAVTSLNPQNSLPVVNGFVFENFKIGNVLNVEDNMQLQVALEMLVALKDAGLNKDIDVINIKDVNEIEMMTKHDISVILCNNELYYKIQMAKSIIEDLLENKRKGIIDMRHEGNPIFKEDFQEGN